MKLYPSSMRRILTCPASKVRPEVYIDTTHQAQIEGNAYHEAMDRILSGDEKTVNEIISNVEHEFQVSIGFMVYNTLKVIKKLEEAGFDLKETEQKIQADFGEYQISGRFDARGKTETHNILVDFKGGYKDTSAEDQLLSYASIINRNEGLTDFKIITIYGRLNNFDVLTVDEIDIQEFNARVQRAIESDNYTAGEHCEYCPHAYLCDAKAKMLEGSVIELGEGNLPDTNPADLFDRVKMIKKAVAKYEKEFKDYVISHEEVQDSEGRTFRIKEDESNAMILTEGSFEALKERLPDNYLNTIKINKTSLKKAIMDEAPRGLKKAEWEAFEGEVLAIEGVKEIKIKKTLVRE